MVVKSSEVEGVSELETLIRLYGIIQKDQVKVQIFQKARVGEFSDAARTVQGIADIGRALSATARSGSTSCAGTSFTRANNWLTAITILSATVISSRPAKVNN
jgi:hypothetical protein